MLVDGGGTIPVAGSEVPEFDIGEQVVSRYLWSRQMKKIHTVVLTHAHADHLNGLLTVLKNFPAEELWIGPGPQSRELDELLQIASSRGVRVVHHWSGDRISIDGVEVEILSPPKDWHPRSVSNNDSLVLRLGYGRRHVLLSGDVEARMERRLVTENLDISSDVLKVAHHGSKTSSTAPLLARIAPSFAMISVGPYRRFGHPNQETLDALAIAGAKVYRTDIGGAVTASTDGNKIEMTRYQEMLRPWPPFLLY
jgi:competence protein ComEC